MAEPQEVTAELLRTWPLPGHGEDKNSSGVAVIIGGSAQTPGAVLLAAEAALRAGCGKVQIVTAASVAAALAVRVPEAWVRGLPETGSGELHPDAVASIFDVVVEADAVLIGPGVGEADTAAELVSRLLPHVRGAVVLDAFATGWLAGGEDAPGPLVATMNPSELARASELEDEDAALATLASRATVVVGGEVKQIGHGDHRYVVRAGGRGLATAGSGDVQAGLVTGLLARRAQPEQAAVFGAWLHAVAGERLAERGSAGFLAREIAFQVPELLDELTPARRGTAEEAGY